MSQYQAIKAATNAYIKTNGRQEITGAILNAVMIATIDSLGKFYQFVGVAVPDTEPGVIDQNIAYLASTPGEYTNLGGITIDAGEFVVIKFDGEWKKEIVLVIPTRVSQLINDAGFITNAVSDLVNYYTKEETFSRNEVSAILTDYYDKDEVDSLVASVIGQSYVVAWDGTAEPVVGDIPAGVSVTWGGNPYVGTLAASADTTNKIYLVSNGAGYDEYITTENEGYSWVAIGTTNLDLSGYALQADVDELRDDVGHKAAVRIDLSVSTWYDGKAIYATTGAEANSGVNSHTNYIDLTGHAGDTLYYTRTITTSSSTSTGLAFYDEDYGYISGEKYVAGADDYGYEISALTIPSNAKYVRISMRTEFVPYFEAYVNEYTGYSDGLGKRVQDLEAETAGMSQDITDLQAEINALDADKNEKIFPLTTMGELQSGVIATSYSSEYAVVNVKKYRGAKIFVNNLHSATGESEILDGADNVLATFSGVGTAVGGVTIPNDAVKMIVSNDFVNNTDFFISVPADLVRNDGLIFGENFLSDYDEGDFSQFNGSVVTDKGLQLPGTGASNGLILNKVVALDNWSLVADVMTEDNTESVSLATKMTQPGTTHHSTRVTVNFNAGTIGIYNNQTSTLVTSASISSIVNGYIYTIKLERVDRAIYATLINRKTGASVSINSQDGAEGSGDEGTNPAGKMFDSPVFYVGSGSPYLQNLYATCLRNAKVFIVGDSITAGAHTTWETTWSAMAAEYFGNSLTGGRGSGQIFCCLNQLRTLLPVVRPKAVMVTIGTNYTTGISNDGYKALFQAIINLILYYGAIPIINNVPACDDRKSNLAKINAVVNGLKQIGCRFDLATSLNNTWADGQDTQYYYADKVHLNVAGNTLLYNIITTQLGWLKNI